MGKDRHAKKKREREALAARGGPSTDLDERVTCYYCDKEYANETTLINHQKNVHFKCEECHRKVSGVTGLQVHCQTVHRSELERIPGAIEGRESIDVEVYGMAGVPRGFLDEMMKKRLRPNPSGLPPGHSAPPFGTAVGAPPFTTMDIPSTFPISRPGPQPSIAMSGIQGEIPPSDGTFLAGAKTKGKAKQSSAISIKLTTSTFENERNFDKERDESKEENKEEKGKQGKPSRWGKEDKQHFAGLGDAIGSSESSDKKAAAMLNDENENDTTVEKRLSALSHKPVTLTVRHDTAVGTHEEGEV